MKRLEGLKIEDKDRLYDLLIKDSNFSYSISEGGFCTNDDVVVGIHRNPYSCSLYALSKDGEENIDKWNNYILDKWNKEFGLN